MTWWISCFKQPDETWPDGNCTVCELDGLRTDGGNFHNIVSGFECVVTKHQANTVKIGFHFALLFIVLEISTCEEFLFRIAMSYNTLGR